MPQLTDEEIELVKRVLSTTVVQNEIGAENWDLTEEEEMKLWDLIHKLGV